MISFLVVPGNVIYDGLTPEQAEQFERLLVKYFDEVVDEKPDLLQIDTPSGLKQIHEQLDQLDNGECLHFLYDFIFALSGDRLAGFLGAYQKDGILYEACRGVNADYRSRGIGTGLVKDLFRLSRERGIREVRAYNLTAGGYETFRRAAIEFEGATLVADDQALVKVSIDCTISV